MRVLPAVCAIYTCFLLCTSLDAQEIVDQWRYSLKEPSGNWQAIDFDDADWTKGPGGFGTRGTPAARIGTEWYTDDIWLRKSFTLDDVPQKPGLLIHHDEEVEVFINGTSVARLDGYTREYIVVELDDASVLKEGDNLLAAHCHQTEGGQFIDVHLIDTESVPQLPEPPQPTTPFHTELITSWGDSLTADNAWTEYPRPQLERKQWLNLNGHWDYAISSREETSTPIDWDGKILVPFSLESRLGGVERLLNPNESLWYRRTFEVADTDETRTLLNFEAVDYRCEVFINGKSIGQHVGGNTPFTFDATDAVEDGSNEIVLKVDDDTEAWQLRGKQVLSPNGIWYTRVSGIWQTVWLEQVSNSYIRELKLATNAAEGTISVRPILEGADDHKVTIQVLDGQEEVAKYAGPILAGVELAIDDAKLWSPRTPHLYDIVVSLLDQDGKVLDSVTSYVGIRDVGKIKDANGDWRFTLNDQELFHWGTLDQGWWPDGLLTPPSDEAMLFDIEYLKAAGFNMIRKHIKVEPRRYYYHCDRLGMLVWQDQVSGGAEPPWTRLEENPVDAQWPAERHAQYMQELEWMISALENHPSIVVWVPFNERWGQHLTMEVGQWTVKRDPSRIVNVASGGNFWPAGDVVDEHAYPHPAFPFHLGENERFAPFVKVVGEFGGHGYPIQDHLWDPNRRNWGYGSLRKTKSEYRERYEVSLEKLDELRKQGIAGAVYTQTTDVEGEINGLMTYDRQVIKIPAKELAELHKRLFVPLTNESPK